MQHSDHPLCHYVAKFIRRRDGRSAILSGLDPIQYKWTLNSSSDHYAESVADVSNENITASNYALGEEGENNLRFHPRLKSDSFDPIMVADQDCAVMMIEIVGFTKLTTALARRGKSGIDLIHGTIGRYICQVIDIVEGFSGDFIK